MLANELFGWTWIALGFVSGGLMGLFFHRPGFLGGYDAWSRRLLRLGHISFAALGILNLLFAGAAARWSGADALWLTASWSFIVGGALMPFCCALAAWRPRLRLTFAAPVLALSSGVACTILAIARDGGVL